jgi:hypothetical protein
MAKDVTWVFLLAAGTREKQTIGREFQSGIFCSTNLISFFSIVLNGVLLAGSREIGCV